jgi:hypothetical protein
MPLYNLMDLLGTTEELKALQARVRRLRELQTLYSRSAPWELADSSRVKNYQAGTLVVCADNAAVAAKLKQLAPRLLASIRQTEVEITKVRIEVQVGGQARARVYESKKAALTPDTVRKFDELATQVKDGGLRSALARLARHHRAARAALDEHQPLDHVQDHHDDHHDKRELKSAPPPGEITPVAGVKKKGERNDDRQ